MFRINRMSLHGLEKDRDEGLVLRWQPEGFLIEMAKQKLENLRGQYENQLDSLRTEIDRSRERRNSKEDDGSGGKGQASDVTQQYKEVKEELSRSLQGDQKDKLDSLVSSMDEQYQAQLEDMHRQHVDDVDEQVKSMRATLEEIYNSQLEIVKSEMSQSHETAMLDQRLTLEKEHKEELNRIEQEYSDKLEQLKLDYEAELKESKLGQAIGKEDSEGFITQLNKKLTEEHRQIIQKIEADLDTSVHRHSQDSQTDGVDSASVASAPVTRSEYKHVAEKQGVLSRTEDAQKSLDQQVEEISALRARMLGEYEQMLSVRAEVMASQSEEVSKLQEEMAQIQQQYENQMAEFQSKVQSQTETALKSAHEQELEEMKQYYEAKVADMEESYTTDIAQLKQEHTELLARLQQESGTGVEIPSLQSVSAGQHREYVRRTTTLTAISDEDITLESTPPGGNEILQGRIRTLEEKLKDKEKLVKELKGRLEAEATSAEDLHGKLLDSNKTLDDFEESLKSKSDEIEELKKLLLSKDEKITELEKAALEEKGEKDRSESGGDENKVISELKERIKKLEEDLSASKEANARIQQELNDLDAQHGEAIMQLKEEMEILNKTKIAEIEAGFQIQLEEELKQQADELDSKYREELSRQTTEELEIYKRTEIDLRQKLNSIQKEHESQIKELKEKYEISLSKKEIQGEKLEMAETQLASPTETLDRDSLEASLRKDVESEILQEYEQSIDKLKNEYEERISDMNARLKSFEKQDTEKAEVSEREKETSDSEEEMKEKLKAELALEFKDKLQSVTDEYESKLKKLQDIVDSKTEMKSPIHGAPYALSRSRSLDTMPQKEKEKPKSQTEYEGYVSTIRREYEDKINSLQMQIAQYRSTVGSVPSSPLSTLQKSQVESGSSDSPAKTDTELDSLGGIQIKTKLGTPELRQEIYDEISSEFEASFKGLRTNYEKQLAELTEKLELLQADNGSYDNRIRQEVVEEYEAKIENLKQEYEAQIRELKSEHEAEVLHLNGDVEKAKSEVLAAQQKVKADMFVWHEETVTQLKRKHEAYESQLRKEYEEKMDLLREELQEGFDAEKDSLIREHKQELIDLEDRYDNLVEGLRTGEVPEVAEIVQEKFDMELEMAKTLIQQECDETIEAEQTRLSEQFDSKMKEILVEKDREQENQRVRYEKEMADLRNTLLQQYEAQVVELESEHKAEIIKLKAAYEKLMQDDIEVEEEKVEKETVSRVKSVLLPQGSVESTQTEEGDKDEESEKVTSVYSTSDKSDKDDDDNDDDKGDGKGGAKAGQEQSQSEDPGDKHDQEREGNEDKTQDRDETGDTQEEISETMIKEVKIMKENAALLKMHAGQSGEDSAFVDKLRKELAAKIVEYESSIAQMKLSHEEEIRQLTEELSEAEAKYLQKVTELEESHEREMKDYQDTIQKLREGLSDEDSDSEALELAHQQELRDLEERLLQKHMNELNNLETQHQSRLDDMANKYKVQIEDLQKELVEAQRAMEQYPDTASPIQTVPIFHGGSTMGSTKESVEDFMVPTGSSRTESEKSESHGATMETQIFEARSGEDRSEEEASQGVSLTETLEEVGVQSLDTSVVDTSMDQSRGTLRGVDTTQDTELIQFSEEEESDKSMEEGAETQKSDRSTPVALMQTLGYGAEIPGDPTVKSLDDTTDSSIRASDKEEVASRIKELEGEVDELRGRLQAELSKQDDQMERMDREKQEESNLTAMLRGDIERLNSDRDALQSTNEHLLGLLSDAVKTYMGVEESITKKMKVMMEKSGDKLTADKGQAGSVERKKTPPPGRRSPASSPGRLSPARADEGEAAADTSIVSNVTDEGLDLSQHISDSIFQGPELKSEEEELLTDSGSRLRSSVNHLLEVMEETTNQLLETRQSQSDAMDTLEGRGHDLDQLTSRCNDLEERLKEEVERKDFLALELHKAEGLIEGYSSERESLDERIHELEEDKETLVLELETTKNKLLDLESIQTENLQLKKEMEEQRDLMSHNVGEEAQATRAEEPVKMSPGGNKALMLEVTRLNSENREKDEQIKQVHERYESRMRELETSGEDMETHLGKILEDKKQEAADLKLQVEALEKQLKAKKQFIEEQSAEREQEHEEYQKELENYRQVIHDLEKQNGTGSRLQTEIDDLTEQLQARIDLHNQALLDSEKYEREIRDKDLNLKELKTIIQQLEQELQDKIQELEQYKQKLKKLEEELARRSYDEDLSDSKSDVQSPKPGSSLEFDGTEDQTRERPPPQMTVEEEMRQAANKTKEELVREKFTLQTQVNDNLVQISSLRNQLDDMRHRRGMGESPDANKRLEFQREKSEEKDKLIADLKLRVEDLTETIENRDQQIEQLRERKLSRGSPVEGIEFESDREMEKQMEALKRENKQLRERVKLSEASSVTDISGLSQNLLEEKNQEIDHLSEQILRLQSDYNDLKAERGVQNLCEELEELRDELKQKDKEISQSVHVSAAFTDHSLTPDSSLMNVGASFSEKASIQQEMEESEASRLEKMMSLESELQALKAALHEKEEYLVTIQTELSTLKEDLQGKDEMILALQSKPEQDLIPGLPDDVGLLQSMIQEKEELVTQLTVQVDSLQAEVDNLSDFQNKLQEDFDTVQTMLEEKDREIESLTKELTDRSPTDDHSLVIKHEVEIARLKKDLREKDNVVEEKLEELAEMTDKVELLETHISKYKEQVREYDDQILAKERELKNVKKQLDAAIKNSTASLTADEKDKMITEKTIEIERLNKELETAALGRPPSPPLSQDEKSQIIKEQKEEIMSLKEHVQKLLGRPPSPPLSEDEKSETIKKLKDEIVKLSTQLEAASLGRPPSPPVDDESDKTGVVLRLRTEIEKLKQQIMDANLSEDDKYLLIRDLRLENETLKKQIDAALKIRPPSPPLDDDEKSERIYDQKKEIESLKSQLQSALKIRPPSPPKDEDEKSQMMQEQELVIAQLQAQVETLQVKDADNIRLKAELNEVTKAIENRTERQLFKEKAQEAEQLKMELEEVKHNLARQSPSSVESVIIEKDKVIKQKVIELEKAEERVHKLEEELESAKEVRAYEDEIQLKEKEDEIEELQAELESFRSRNESTLGQSIDLEMSLNGDSEASNSKQLVKSLSFYKEQYEEKCSEARQVQVQLDLVKQQLEKARSDKLEDAQEEIELFKAELERKNSSEVKVLKTEKDNLLKEKEELIRELKLVKERLDQSSDEQVKSIEKELQLTKDELARERMDSVQAINDLERLRERKEKERRGSIKTIQELEHDLEEKVNKEKQLSNQIKQLSEELAIVKKQYGIEEKGASGDSSRTSPKLGELRSQGSFELGTDVETLQQQVLQFKQQSDKTKEILSEKQKYQSQYVKLEIQHEQLQKKMKKEVGELEEKLKAYTKQPDYDVWAQLHATQDKLEKTTEQLTKTGERLNETDASLNRVSADLASREADLRELQQELWKTSGQLSVTSGKLQETEEKLRQTISQLTEREEQITQLQGELQNTQHEIEKVTKKSKEVPYVKPGEVEKLRKQLKTSQTELEAVKKSLNEAVEMSEQQLQMVESKDQEYVKLKLDIQQTLSDKEKTIRDQKNKLKEKEQEIIKLKQEVKGKEKEVTKIKQEVEEGSSTSTIASLRAQLQSQEEMILNLETDLRESQSAVEERDKDIENIHKTHKKSKDEEADTIQAMHNQIAELQSELQVLRSATKAQGDPPRPQDAFDRGLSQGDGNGPEMVGTESSDRDQTLGDHHVKGKSEHIYTPGGFSISDQEDSGHQSFGHHSRDPHFSPEGQSLSPRQLRPYAVQIIAEDMQATEAGQVRSSPSGSGTVSIDRGQGQQSGSGSRPGSAHSASSRGSSRHSSPHTVGTQDFVVQAYSPPTRDSPHSQSSLRNENMQSQRSSVRSSPVEVQYEQGTEFHRSPSRTSEQLDQKHEGSGLSMTRSPNSNKKSSASSSPKSVHSDKRSVGSKSTSSGRSPAFDGDGEELDRRIQQSITADRQTIGASFTIDENRQVYQSGTQSGDSMNERYVSEDGQLFDRDGNIRPRYSHSTESQTSQDFSRRSNISPSEAARDEYLLQHHNEGQESSQSRSLGSQGMGAGEGSSSEAERYIQQLRRELLITKTALMQIQRGERLDREDISPDELADIEAEDRSNIRNADIAYLTQTDRISDQRELRYDTLPSEENLNRLKRKLERAEEEIQLFRSSSNLSARDFVQKVMNLKDELSNEHQRHIEEMTKRAHNDTETQLATMRIKYTDEIEHIKRKHSRELEEKLHDQKNKMERKHKSETNKLILKHQEEVGVLKLRAGEDIDDTLVSDRQHRQRQEGVGADHGMMNGHGAEPMSQKLQGILQRLHSEGVQVLTISELELLNRSQSLSSPGNTDIESMRAGWENERQTMLSTIQSLKDLLSQTHKLRGLDKDNDDDDDNDMSLEGSDWRAELLRAIGYVFTKERETLLAELRSHVLSHPSTNLDETQRLEQKIRTMESHHHAALDQIFNADRQSMLAEIRDLRAHATIARMHHQEERDRLADKVTSTEDLAVKKERQLKREDSEDTDSEYADLPKEPEPVDFISAGVQLLEFKIQQEKVLQDDLRTSLDSERNRSGELSSLLNQEKTSNLDLQTSVSALQTQVSKLRESLEREQSRYVSVTNALEEEKSKSLNLSDLLESERETLWRVQAELEALKQQQVYADPRAIEQLQAELNNERDRRCQADSQHEIDMVTMENLRQEVEMGKRRLQGIESELEAKVSQLQRNCDMERQKITELNRVLDRERSLSAHLQQSLEAEKSTSERNTHQEQSMIEDLHIQLQTERANLDDLNLALQREQRAREEAESEKSLIKDHLNQERALNEDMKHDLDKLQFERLEAVNQLQKEREMMTRIKSERDQINDELRKMKSQELQAGSDREAERLASKKSVREADRQKEEYRMKLHEQELETQRLSQKITSMQEQLAESQENELKAIRELEQLRIETASPEEQMVSVQTSPRPDFSDGMSQDFESGRGENWHVYRSQLESMCQSLHYLILRCREQLNKTTHSGARQTELSDYDTLQKSLRDLLSEVKQLQEMEGEYMNHPSGSVNERILRQNEELTNFVARISEEKTELRNTLGRLEEEIWRYRQMDSKYQEMQRATSSVDHQLIAERSEWAKEKLSLQMAINSAEREIDLLQTDLRVERERRVAAGITETKDNDKIKIQRLYGKYLRAESFRKALIYQKKYLLILLGGFQDTEETTLALLSRMGAMDSNRPNGCRRHTKPLTTFRGAVRVVIAIQRMKFLVKKWRRATRVGSEVVGGTVDQTNGYVPHSNGYSPARASPRVSSIPVRSASSSPARAMSYLHPSPSRATENAVFLSPRLDMDSVSSSSHTSPRVTTTSHVPYTPPTKDYSSTTKYSSPSTGARRKILTSTSIPAPRSGRVRFTSDETKNGELVDSEDYIHRLENLQTRLGTLQNGRKSSYRQAWR